MPPRLLLADQQHTQLHPGFRFAAFNLGVSLMITKNHVGAVLAFDRSLELEPWNTKVMVYLGQASILLD